MTDVADTGFPRGIRVLRQLVVVSCMGLLTLAAVVQLIKHQGLGTLIQVHPPSLPGGVYWSTTSDTLTYGTPTLICVPGRMGELALERGYLGSNAFVNCPPPSAAAVKMLAALPGDTVQVTRDSIRVNSRSWIRAPMLATDSRGREMPDGSGTFILVGNECFALTLLVENSFDSRYFGPIPCPTPPIRTAWPLSPTSAQVIDSLQIELLK